jgi:hypothetical protein
MRSRWVMSAPSTLPKSRCGMLPLVPLISECSLLLIQTSTGCTTVVVMGGITCLSATWFICETLIVNAFQCALLSFDDICLIAYRVSEWVPIKISPKKNRLSPKLQPKIPTCTCQGHVVTSDLLTLRISPNKLQSGSTTQEAKDLGKSACLGLTVRPPAMDGPSRLADGPTP